MEIQLSTYCRLYLALLLYVCAGCVTNSKAAKYQIGTTNWVFGEYFLLNASGDTIKKLEKHDYIVSFAGNFEKFAVLGIRGERDWCAIDIHENILFKVANIPLEEPFSPDHLVEDRIRIIDTTRNYGFANTKGKIVIKPQFELVTQFHNGFAIIAEDCHKVYWKDDEETDDEETDHVEHEVCNHYSLKCNKHGYIDKRGKIIKFGNYTFEEIQKEIGWEQE